MTLPPCAVIDTNVWAVAEGMHPGASDQCVAACLALLAEVEGGLALAVDQDDEILTECLGALRASGTAGLAVKLITRVWRTRMNGEVCKPIAITPRAEPPGSYNEVPDSLRNFDADDQKFFAVALAHEDRPPLFQALDKEWWERRLELVDAGLDVQFLCPAHLFGDGS
jgi:hypothetical protein